MAAVPHVGQKKVNRLVTYVTAAGKLRPAVITALGAGNLVDLRVGRHSETYSSVDHCTGPTDTDCWYVTSRRHL